MFYSFATKLIEIVELKLLGAQMEDFEEMFKN